MASPHHDVAMFSLQNPTLWVAAAAVLFIALVWQPLGRMLANAFDKRAADIRKEIEEAEALLSEAKTLLAKYTGELVSAESQARKIIAQAEAEAFQIRQHAAKELEHALIAREQHALARIQQAEAAAVAEIRDATVALTMDATRTALRQHMNDNHQTQLLQKAVDAVGSRLR